MIAVNAGAEVVNVYPLAGWHGMRPRDNELIAFYDDVLPNIHHPVALSINPITGYTPGAALMADVVAKYDHIVAVNFFDVKELYVLNFRDRLTRDVGLYVPVPGSLNPLTFGATGLIGAAANVIPRTHREYIDLFESRHFDAIGTTYAHIMRFSQFVAKWGPSNARWIKMALRVLGLPGGHGALRAPYQMPLEEELHAFTKGLVELRIPEIEDYARAGDTPYLRALR
jgi:dihydrodipicolinate synthase/N-acetylneuraminate lyase